MASPSEARHRAMYKAGTSPWRDSFRKRCLDRLKSSRAKIVNRFRVGLGEEAGAQVGESDVVREVMEEEWKRLVQEDSVTPSNSPVSAGTEDDLDSILALMEDIKQELLKEEHSILAQLDAEMRFEEEAMLATVDHHHGNDDDVVTCPVCMMNPLLQNKNVIFCQCGVRINTEQDCIGLHHVKQRLTECVTEHSERCAAQPGFTVADQCGIQNLVMACAACDALQIVI
ncbi:RPA-interacting protein B-like [Branchiostoma floridae x Branchiostoma japonicum]